MGKTIVEYDVFIASPGDVKEERQVVHEVCRNLNDDILVDNIQFKAVGWEDAIPGAKIRGQSPNVPFQVAKSNFFAQPINR